MPKLNKAVLKEVIHDALLDVLIEDEGHTLKEAQAALAATPNGAVIELFTPSQLKLATSIPLTKLTSAVIKGSEGWAEFNDTANQKENLRTIAEAFERQARRLRARLAKLSKK